MATYDFPGVALVTGAGHGMGRATAILFAKEGCKRICIADINAQGLEETKKMIEVVSDGVTVRTAVCDNTDEKQVQSMVDGCVQQFGRVDYATNIAGITILGPTTADMPTELWEKDNHTNLRGLFFCERSELKAMLNQEPLKSSDSNYPLRGSIVNVGSMAGLTGRKELPHYCASKHGVVGLSKADGLFYGKFGIRVNCVCPGPTKTGILSNNGISDMSKADELRASASQNALGRWADPEELAQALVWVSSGRASYMTASVLAVNGGQYL
ncbi:hypothetical protein CLAIMM_00103 [Cladophialophora immunda]|nr:hypothetical protein CLAIMM_00103 [Cladophialophora immunda]